MTSSRWITRFLDLNSRDWTERGPRGIRGRVLGPERLRYDPDVISVACVLREEESGEVVHVILDRELQHLFAEHDVAAGDRVGIDRDESGGWRLKVQPASRFRKLRLSIRAALLEALLSAN